MGVRTEGLNDLLGKFDKIEKDLPKNTGEAIEKSALYVNERLKQLTPVDTGNMQESEGIEFERSGGLLNGMTSKAFVGPGVLKPADYAIFVELGHRTRSGSWVPGQFFVERAYFETKGVVESIIRAAIKTTLNS